MEIERKFLLKEKNKIFPSPFDVEKVKKEILKKGKKISQHYLPKKLIPEIAKELKFNLKFPASQLRLRKLGKNYYLTIKSTGNISREEYEIKIKKEIYNKYIKFKKKSLEKIRLKKIFLNYILEFDYYPKYELLILEIEFKSIKDAKRFKIKAKDITKIKKYGNKQLAK